MNRLHKILLTLMIASLTIPIFAHGVAFEHEIDPATGAVTIYAAFDTGEVFDEGQVAVFAPSDLANPWMTGTTDSDGVFTFTPDYSIEGTWDIQVRKAGHGGLINLQLTGDMITGTPTAATTETPTGQTLAMSAAVVLGFVGVAFYFSNRRKDQTIS